MQTIPVDILEQFSAVLGKRAVPASCHADYKKWLRFYLDFRAKYPLPDSRSEHVRLFIQKLRDKRQTPEQQKQAAHALSLFFESQPAKKLESRKSNAANLEIPPIPHSPIPLSISPLKGEKTDSALTAPDPIGKRVEEGPLSGKKEDRSLTARGKESGVELRGGRQFNEWRCMEKSKSPDWDKLIDNLAGEIKTRHYSRKTLKAYADWSRKFQSYLKNKSPDALMATDVKEYLTHLAVKCHVAASTQNQAFNASLFLFRHILKKDFGDMKDVPRAKKSKYIPVVLSRREIDALLQHLKYPYNLIVKLLYGCGLRLFECVKLRVKNFNFDAGILTVHGKGNKDRTVPIPQTIMPELTAQFEAIKKLHEEDLAAGYAGVFLEDQLEKNIRKPVRISYGNGFSLSTL